MKMLTNELRILKCWSSRYEHMLSLDRLGRAGLLHYGRSAFSHNADVGVGDGSGTSASKTGPPPAPTAVMFAKQRKHLRLVASTSNVKGIDRDDGRYSAFYGYMPLLAAVVDKIVGYSGLSADLKRMVGGSIPCHTMYALLLNVLDV